MIVTLLLWGLVTLTVFSYGITCSKILYHTGILSGKETDFYRVCLWGLSFLSTLLAIISLFSAINGAVFGVLTGLTFIQLFFYRKDFKNIFQQTISWKGILLRVIIGVIILVYAIRSDYGTSDTGLYHAQAIQWCEKYPVVPGLGNLHNSLGENIHFFLLSAFFGLSFTGTFFHVLNSWFILFFCLYSVSSFYKTNNIKKKIVYALFVVLGFIFRFKTELPNTDLPIVVLTAIIFSLLLDYVDPGSQAKKYNTLVLIAVTGFLGFTFKLTFSVFFAFIFLFVIYIKWKESYKALLRIVLLFGFMVLPWLARNMILSGYFLYPVSTVHVFNFSWRVPEADVHRTQAIIKEWNIDPDLVKSPMIEELQGIPEQNIFDGYFHKWYMRHARMDRIYLIIFVLSFFLSLAFAIRRVRLHDVYYIPVICIWFVILISTFAWIASGPSIRYFFGTIWISFCIPVMLAPDFKISTKALTIFSRYILVCIVLYYTIEPLRRIVSGEEKLTTYFVLPEPRYPKVETISFYENNFKAIRPKTGIDCWNEPLPCLPCEFMHVKMRGSSFKDGFISTDPLK